MFIANSIHLPTYREGEKREKEMERKNGVRGQEPGGCGVPSRGVDPQGALGSDAPEVALTSQETDTISHTCLGTSGLRTEALAEQTRLLQGRGSHWLTDQISPH